MAPQVAKARKPSARVAMNCSGNGMKRATGVCCALPTAIFCGRWPPVARAGAGAAFWGASAPGPGQHFPPGLKARSPRPAPGGTTAQAAAPVNGTPGALPASAPLPGIPVRLADAFRRIRCLCPASELQGTPSAASPLQPNPTKLPLLGGVVDRHKGTFRLRPELRRESAALKII